MKGFNCDEVPDFVDLTKTRNIDVRFIEYMPFDGNQWTDVKMVPYNKLLDSLKEKFPTLVKIEDKANDTSKVVEFSMIKKLMRKIN